MKIRDIVYKRKGNRYVIFLDDGTSFETVPEIVYAYRMEEGLDIDKNKVKKESKIFICKEYALRLLKDRIYSYRDMKNKLKNRCEDVCNDVLDILEKAGFINDKEYAEIFFEEQKRKGKSKKEIVYKLKYKGISEDIIAEIIDNRYNKEDEKEMIYNLAIKYLRKIASKKDKKMRLIRYLLSKGFDYDDINEILNNIQIEEE